MTNIELLKEIKEAIYSLQNKNFDEWAKFLIPGKDSHDKCKYHEGVYVGLDKACDLIRDIIIKELNK